MFWCQRKLPFYAFIMIRPVSHRPTSLKSVRVPFSRYNWRTSSVFTYFDPLPFSVKTHSILFFYICLLFSSLGSSELFVLNFWINFAFFRATCFGHLAFTPWSISANNNMREEQTTEIFILQLTIMVRWLVNNALEKSGTKQSWFNLRYYPEIRPEKLTNITRNVSQKSRSKDRGFNLGYTEYKARILLTRHVRLVQWPFLSFVNKLRNMVDL
jgi:hypothetical protein